MYINWSHLLNVYCSMVSVSKAKLETLRYIQMICSSSLCKHELHIGNTDKKC